jgi:hypothetical protein
MHHLNLSSGARLLHLPHQIASDGATIVTKMNAPHKPQDGYILVANVNQHTTTRQPQLYVSTVADAIHYTNQFTNPNKANKLTDHKELICGVRGGWFFHN